MDNFKLHPNDKFNNNYSYDEIVKLIVSKKIDSKTEIWHKQWGEWKNITETDFKSFLKESSDLKNSDGFVEHSGKLGETEEISPSKQKEKGIWWYLALIGLGLKLLRVIYMD